MKKVKALVFGGGKIHDWQGIQPKLVAALEACDAFELTTVQENLDALLDLNSYDVLVFHYTVGTISDAQRDALSNWLISGKGYVGIHSAADSFRGDPAYSNIVGGHFITHPPHPLREYQVSVKDPEHPIMAGIAEDFIVEDEQYVLDYDTRVNILANALYKGDTMPVAWTKQHGQGRVFYQALGHDPKACEHPVFKQMLVQGALWAAGQED